MIDTCSDQTTAIIEAEDKPPVRSRAEALRLFADNEALVGDVLKRSGWWAHSDADSIRQAALMGLWHAAQRFDESRGLTFSTFAWPVIRGYALRELRRSNLVVIPDAIHGERRAELLDRLTPTALPGDRRHYETHGYLVEDTRADEREQIERAEAIERALACLDGRSGLVLRRRFLDGLTLEDVATELCITKQRVKQIESKALERLRERAPQLLDWLAA
jgi:RNA polymerase sigma factor (sigma-70 family)